MLVEGGALVRINDAARGNGIIVAQQNPAYDVAKAVPTVSAQRRLRPHRAAAGRWDE